MLTASFSGVLKTILIILLVYFGFKILIRWFGPLILKWFLKKAGKQFQSQFDQFQQQSRGRSSQPEGKVSIDKKPKNNRRGNKKVGEYIDYEEID
ncbi:DUF4834 family protein [Salegentibacter sp. HM20]